LATANGYSGTCTTPKSVIAIDLDDERYEKLIVEVAYLKAL
jgi:hypothetical protein